MAFMTGDAAPWDIDDLMSRRGAGTPRFLNFPAIAAARVAGTRQSICIMTDSTGDGWGANGAPGGSGVAGDENNGRRARSWPSLTSDFLTSRGIPSRYDAIIGGGTTSANTTAQYTAQKPWVTFAGSGWSLSATTSIGGRLFENTTTTDAWTFTPLVPANSFDIYYVQSSGFATFTVTDASGTLATINASGTLSVIKATVTRATASLAPISIQRNGTGTTLRLIGVVPFDTTDPCLEIWNMGWAGSQTSNWTTATNAVSPFNAITAVVPTQWIIELGANDANASVADATYGANMASLADRLLASAPVSLGIPPAARDGGSTYNIPAGYVTELATVKAARPTMTPDFNFRALTFNSNDYFDSSVHMDKSGCLKRAREALRMLA